MSTPPHLRPELVFGFEHQLLTADELAEVQAHIAACPDCRQILARRIDLNPMVDEMRTAFAAPAPAARFFSRFAAAAAILVLAGATAWFARHTEADSVQEALSIGHIPLPKFVAQLADSHQVLMGEAGRSSPQLLSPKATAVFGPRPQFEWQSLNGAWTYQVRIFTLDGDPAAASPKVRETRWICDRDLAPGSDYQWQVTATRGAERVTLPSPADTPPRFRVLDSATAARLRDLSRRQPDAHLLLGVEFGRAGLLEEARRQLSEAARLKPSSVPIRQLLQSLTPEQ